MENKPNRDYASLQVGDKVKIVTLDFRRFDDSDSFSRWAKQDKLKVGRIYTIVRSIKRSGDPCYFAELEGKYYSYPVFIFEKV